MLGSVTSIPAGFVIETLVSLGSGVRGAMLGWGDRLLARYGKHRYAYKRDYILTHLGYSTVGRGGGPARAVKVGMQAKNQLK